MTLSTPVLHALVESQTPLGCTGWVVAISGGADSAALLAALVQPRPPARRQLPLRAIHVDHGLQAASTELRRACEALCRRLEVPLSVVTVTVTRARGVSLEAAARVARYDAIARTLAAGECLLTAHHADDQAETFLLQLLRGAGVKGLAAMPPLREWRGGWHLRPLLHVTRDELRRLGEALGVEPVPDPMNDDLRFDRVYLRSRLWPVIEARWPGAALTLARSAGHLADAESLLDDVADREVRRLRDGRSLFVPGLRGLSALAQVNVLRHWIAGHGVQSPSTARLHEARRQILGAQADHLPAIVWGEHALRRYRDRVFVTPARPCSVGEARVWPSMVDAVLDLGSGLGTLHWRPLRGGLDPDRLPATLVVRQRRGGETLKPQARAKTQTLQHLCQSMGVLPWMRDALPLLYAGEDLVAVAGLWQDARWCVARGRTGMECDWRNAPEFT